MTAAGQMTENEPLQREKRLEEYRAKIREGMESGPGIPAEEVFARLEAKYQATLERRA